MFRIRPRILTRRIRPLGRLGLEMVEEGVTDLDDILRERLGSLQLECDRARSALDRIRARHARKPHDGGYSLPQGWMRTVIERIEVDDGVIRIIGNTSAQEQALDGNPEASGGVRRSVLKWHARAEKPNARTRQCPYRGRDARCRAPPAQIHASDFPTRGPYTAKRTLGHGW